MSTSGIERGFFSPFLGNGIAQSLGQIPLAASALDLDVVGLERVVAQRGNGARTRVPALWALLGAGDDFALPPVAGVPEEAYWITRPAPRPLHTFQALPFLELDQAVPTFVPLASPAPLINRLLLEQVKQSIAYRTDVLTAWSGLEQRIALAPYPRESISFQVVLADADLRTMRGLLFTAPETPVLLPMRVEETAAIADVTGTTITIDSRLIDWPDTNVGWAVLVENFAGQSYVVNVLGVTGYGTSSTVLTVDASPPAGQAFPAGSHVIPLRSVYLQDGPLSARYPVNAGVLHLAGVVQPVRVTIGTGATVTTFDGLPVFDRRVNADQAVQESNMARLAWIDSGAGGPVSTRTALAVADLLRANVFVIKSLAERQWLRKFWQTVLGRQGLFLCPTWKTDLDLFAQPIGGSSTIVIDNDPNYVTTWFPSLAHRRLQLNFTDGTVGYVKITAAVDNGNGTQSLTTSAPLVVPTTVASISLLEQVRFDTDELVITWQSTNGRCPVPMMVVQQ